jgi:hypothetical protein
MNIDWDKLTGRILGVIITVWIVKTYIAPDLGCWEIVEQMVRGIVGM